METSFEVVDDGYIARVTGVLGLERAADFWAIVQAHRPADGFRFGVLDVTGATTPLLDDWPVSVDTLETLHPIVRYIRETTRPGFRFGFVTSHPHATALVEDLRELSRFGVGTPHETSGGVRRFDSVDEALVWCRGDGVDEKAGPAAK